MLLLVVVASRVAASSALSVDRRGFCCCCGAAAIAPQTARAGIVEDFVLPQQQQRKGLVDNFSTEDDEASLSSSMNKATVATRVLIVRGAQLADALDARWDALSYSLRKQRPSSSPAVSEPKKLDLAVAERVRNAGNDAAAWASGKSLKVVDDKIAENRETFKGVLADGGFQFETYCAFRAYNSLAANERSRFEEKYGDLLYSIFPPDDDDLEYATESMLEKLVDAGFAARSQIDFVDGVDSRISATLYRPIELRPRLLLETQSRRLGLTILPDIATTLLRAHLRKIHKDVRLEEYFVDTEYRTTFDKDDYTALQIEIVLS